jgi:hypothetical protein
MNFLPSRCIVFYHERKSFMQRNAQNWSWRGSELDPHAATAASPPPKTPGIKLVSLQMKTLLPKEETACAMATD